MTPLHGPSPTEAFTRRRRLFPGALMAAAAVAILLLPEAGSVGTAAACGWKERPQRIRLSAGIDCLYQKDETSQTTVVLLFIRGGKSLVPPGKDGLAYIAARLALEIPDSDKARNLMIQATRSRVAVFEDYSAISIECLSENLEAALDIMSDIIQDPLFSGLRIDHAKKTMALLGKAQDDDAVDSGHAAALRAFFDGRGCGSDVYGTTESLKSLSKKDITGFYDSIFTKDGVFFSVSSDLGPEKIKPLLEASFKKIPAGGPGGPSTAPAVPSLPAAEKRVRLDKDTKQTYIARVFPLPAISPSDYARAFLLEVLLGRGPGSRLWDLRVKERLAYNVNARVTWTKGGGVLEAYLETDKSKAERAVPSLARTIQTLFEGGTTADELTATKALAKASFLRANEMKQEHARTVGFFEVAGLGADFMTGALDALDAVTLEDMNAFIGKVLDPQRAVDVLVGPAAPPAAPGGPPGR